MIIAIILISVSLILIIIEIKAFFKRRQLNYAIQFVTESNPSNKIKSTFIEASLLSIGSSTTNLYDIYAACDNHSDVLNVLEYRYNNIMGDASPLDWYSKIELLKDRGTKSIDSYIKGYTGQQGEFDAKQFLDNQGQNSSLFENRSHPDDDLFTIDHNGDTIEYSVKSFKNQSNFLHVVSQHPDSHNYIINHELYDKLHESGALDTLNEQGIDVIDGGFSHDDAWNAAENAFDDIKSAGDLSNNIPYIALALFGFRTVRNIKKYSTGKQSGFETRVDIGLDAVRIGTSGVLAVAGAKVGAAIGTGLAPGVGTLVGGGIGIIVGAIVGSSLINYLKEKFKWGDIIEAIDYVGDRIFAGYYNIPLIIKSFYRKMYDFEYALEAETQLMLRYQSELNPYNSTKVTVNSALTYVHTKVLKSIQKQISKAGCQFERDIRALCWQAAMKMSNNDTSKSRKIQKRLIGELICANSDIFSDVFKTDSSASQYLYNYNQQIKSSPNHPYRFNHDSKAVIQSIIIKAADDNKKLRKISIPMVNIPLLILITIILTTGILYILSMYNLVNINILRDLLPK
jgi:hypothetical protein